MVSARALAVDAEVLLLDEPFSEVNAEARPVLRSWLRSLHLDALGIRSGDTVYVRATRIPPIAGVDQGASLEGNR